MNNSPARTELPLVNSFQWLHSVRNLKEDRIRVLVNEFLGWILD